MALVDIVSLDHDKGCEKGYMFKTALEDDYGNPAAFALIFQYHQNYIYFRGFCSHCGKVFEKSYILESLLRYTPAD